MPALFKRLKIPKPKGGALHLLRHTLASQMLDSGVPLSLVAQRLGHSSPRVAADVYSHAIHGQDDEAVRRWEQYQRNRPAKPENWKNVGALQRAARTAAGAMRGRNE
ncbi:MAG: tyrosine-type recombinase/integrase [Bryobacteraceae bacterium]